MWCVAWCVCVCGVLVLVLVFGGGVVWCGVVWCGVVCVVCVWCVVCVVCLLSLSFFLLSSFLSSLLSSLFSSSFSSLFSSRHQTLWKESINQHGGQHSRHLNVICRRASAQQSVLSLLLSPLLPLPSPPQKKEETFYYRNISGKGIILHHSFK